MLCLTIMKGQVLVLHTSDGPIVIRLQPESSKAKVAIQAPDLVQINRESEGMYPVPPPYKK